MEHIDLLVSMPNLLYEIFHMNVLLDSCFVMFFNTHMIPICSLEISNFNAYAQVAT